MFSRPRALAVLFAIFLSFRGEAMPFSVLTDNPIQWGCSRILVLASSRLAGAELYIPSSGIEEVSLVPWENHLSTRVSIRLRDEGRDVTHALPLSLDTLRTFTIAGVDRRRTVNQALRHLRNEARRHQKHFWQIIAIAGPTGGRRRILWRSPLDFSDRASAQKKIQDSVLPFFREGGGLRMDDEVNIFILSADDKFGLPPTLEELGYVNAIFSFALPHIAGDPARFPGRRLVMLVKLTSTPTVHDLLFAYDPWEDDRRAWAAPAENAAATERVPASPR